ncbi:MAG: hypothetical protein ACFFAQ_14215 [Promethearchaeota archaeon]
MTVCEFCGKFIGNNKWGRVHQHINICQQPEKRVFCSDKCKLSWIFRVMED